MKKKAILALLVLTATSLSLTGCNKDNGNKDNGTDLEKAHDFILDISAEVSWEAFEYTYDWGNLTGGDGEAYTLDLQLTEKNFYPYGAQTEIWYTVLQNEPTHPEETNFYFSDGYGFEPDAGLAWTYGDTYDDAIDYYTDGFYDQVLEEASGVNDEFITDVDLEYTGDVITGATFYHHAETEGVGVVDDYFTYRTDTNHVLTQYIYEQTTTVDQEYEGEDVHLVIYSKHNLREINASQIVVPAFNLDDYNIEGVEPGYDIEVPTIPGHGEVVNTETLDETAAQEYINTTDLDAIYEWTGYAYDWPSLSEGGYEQIEYIAEVNDAPYGIVEEYLGNPGGEGTLVEGTFYKDGYQYEYAPASSGEGAEVGSAVATTETYSSLLEEKLLKLKDDAISAGFFYELKRALDPELENSNAEYFVLTATRTTYDDGTIAVDIDYKADFTLVHPEYEMSADYQDYDVTYYFDTNLKLIGISALSEQYAEYNGTVQSHTGYNHILYEITPGNVTAVLPEWTANF